MCFLATVSIESHCISGKPFYEADIFYSFAETLNVLLVGSGMKFQKMPEHLED